jgi:UDP-N-acetylmuramyl tripeptide synthase
MPARSEELQEALVIPVPEDPALVLDGCRRLLGPNLYSDQPGAVGDGLSPGFDPALMLRVWEGHARALLAALGWRAAISARPFDGGASIFFEAPVDQLFTAAYVIEASWHYTASELMGREPVPLAKMVSDLAAIAAREASPALVRLVQAAGARGIDRLLDDDAVTLGHGAGSRTWGTEALPETPDWDALHDIPLALVTGTNGKTTTTRLIAAMGQAAGRVSGLSSTEFVRVGDEILDRGDYSGPAGARLLLRDRRLELGVLEVARGGILRRGVPVTRARAAVVTNVAADHLGQYGINTVPDLAQVKLAVRRGLSPEGWLILNAGDEMVRAAARGLPAAPVWFALDPACAEIRGARAEGRPCGWLEDGVIVLSEGGAETRLIAAAEVPLTLGGAARYNIENALAAALAARALGLPDTAIRGVLATFRSDPKDNPGRANEFAVNGARVFVDFAHNPHSIAAVTAALAALPAKRRFVLLTHAGDRSDADIRALTDGAFALRPDCVVAAENPKYLRGRQPGEVSGLIRQASLGQGLAPDRVLLAESPAAGAEKILGLLAPGDLALLLVHDERVRIFAMLAARGAAVA